MSLMAWKRLSGLERGYLRVIVAGGVYTQQRLFDMHKVKSAHCQHCGAQTNEDQQHIWWDCPAWQAVRERHPDALAEYDRQWPACLRLNGVMPEAQYDAAETQREQDPARGSALGEEARTEEQLSHQKDRDAVPAQMVRAVSNRYAMHQSSLCLQRLQRQRGSHFASSGKDASGGKVWRQSCLWRHSVAAKWRHLCLWRHSLAAKLPLAAKAAAPLPLAAKL
eukprot:gene19452-biopygen4945